MTLAVIAAIVAAYLYAAALAWRVGHSGRHGRRVWSPPRPTRIRHVGAHARPLTPAPASTAQADPAGLAVAA
ncbi:hypothetical protein [Actinomadura geliboluensis]|uniref:hypothetical protein n=1 Tax=Actinomadura geliboluensis TaxID=882440 RepID=UPI0036809E18